MDVDEQLSADEKQTRRTDFLRERGERRLLELEGVDRRHDWYASLVVVEDDGHTCRRVATSYGKHTDGRPSK